MMSLIVGIRFHKGGKTYHFDATGFPDLEEGDYVVVETMRGQQLGQIVVFVDPGGSTGDQNWKPIQRKATPRDLVLRQILEGKEEQALAYSQQLGRDLALEEVKFVSAEYSLDGENLIFLYSYDGKEDPDLSEFLKRLGDRFPEHHVELRRIGPRDAAKIIGGMGACGKGIRCCTEYMTEFEPISIRMAKEQGVSLAPSEITGMCGRLRCCLMYEHEQYLDAKEGLPECGKRVNTPRGEGEVVRLNPLQKEVHVDLGESGVQKFENQEIE
ncbi:MAG: regulatory iron-sulfur-containing complex subunit RicT [Anaerolineales bacterium]